MEYADGGDLREVIAKAEKSNRFLPESDIWRVCRNCAEGLSFMHSKNIIHMDIKPQNILIVGPTIKLVDFGVS